MRLTAIAIALAALMTFAGCAGSRSSQSDRGVATRPAENAEPSTAAPRSPSTGTAAKEATTVQDGQMKPASLVNAQNSQGSVTVTERKLIRNADLTIESTNPGDTQRRISSIAESHSGFVVSSEAKQTNAEGELKPE